MNSSDFKKIVWLSAIILLLSVVGFFVGLYYWKYGGLDISSDDFRKHAYTIEAFLFLEFISLLYSIILLSVKNNRQNIILKKLLVTNLILSATAFIILLKDSLISVKPTLWVMLSGASLHY